MPIPMWKNLGVPYLFDIAPSQIGVLSILKLLNYCLSTLYQNRPDIV